MYTTHQSFLPSCTFCSYHRCTHHLVHPSHLKSKYCCPALWLEEARQEDLVEPKEEVSVVLHSGLYLCMTDWSLSCLEVQPWGHGDVGASWKENFFPTVESRLPAHTPAEDRIWEAVTCEADLQCTLKFSGPLVC